MANPNVLEATDTNFNAEVENASLPTIVDFWAVWCGPCRQIAPALDQLAEEFQGKVRVAKVNVDHSPRTVERYGIRAIPTLVVIKDGKEVDRLTGASMAKLKSLFERAQA